ncbi:serine hydrolase domain-containing protein [Streptomyces sp. bgisy100]|uniref:serine hydrolase domain-containing protein n=1 Tax=Streptomyces sp. bgisy100 TaxID=3413783 RepID=UPI003D73A2F2
MLAVGTAAGTGHAAPSRTPRDPGALDRAAVRRELTTLIATQNLPGAQAVITDAAGRVTEIGAGAGDLDTGRPFPHRSRLRVGSNTKSFIATVVLQLVAAGRVVLDAPVERYLPGTLHGNGHDGRRISVRRLLQHTSGLPDFEQVVDVETPGHRRPEQVVALTLRYPPRFPPGARWEYCNLNYVLLGMLIERVTGHSYEHEVERRVIQPLGLPHTYWPRWSEQRLHGPHPTPYRPTENGGHREVTCVNTSGIGAAGALVATAQDLTVFFTALLSGALLPAAQLAQLRATVPADLARGAEYGLGLARYPLDPAAGGGWFWGHGGTLPGTRTRGGVGADGRAVLVAVNEAATGPDSAQAVTDTVGRIFRHVPRKLHVPGKTAVHRRLLTEGGPA